MGAGKGPKGKGKGDVGQRGQTGLGAGAAGGGRGKGRVMGGRAPPQPDVQPVRCIPRKVYSVFSTVFLPLLLLAIGVGLPAACFGR